MGDLKNPRLIWAKGVLFLILGFMAAGTILVLAPDLRVAALLVVCVWAFCRSYYFAFYVIQNYVDADYRYAGLTDFVRYALGKKTPRPPDA